MKRRLIVAGAMAAGFLVASASPALAQEGAAASQFVLDNLWIFIAGVLVFFMQAGFALVEAGLTRGKNVSNIMMKNLMDMSAGVLAFALVGFGIAFGFIECAARGFFALPAKAFRLAEFQLFQRLRQADLQFMDLFRLALVFSLQLPHHAFQLVNVIRQRGHQVPFWCLVYMTTMPR